MKPVLNLMRLNSVSILDQLRLEETLLRTDHQNWCIINTGSPPAIVMGISGEPAQLINKRKWEQSPIPIIRRFSGGGTVVVDEETLFVTFICGVHAINISPFPRKIMEWSSQFYQPLFKNHLFELKENDYVLNEKKWGGNAQSIIKNRWLHHSSLLWNFQPELMDYLLIPSKAPDYRNQRPHVDFLCRLSDYWEDKLDFLQLFLLQLNHYFNVFEKNISDINHLHSIPHRKSTSLIENIF